MATATKLTQYMPTTHAIERFREYFGVKEIYAIDFSNEIMADAHFIMKQPDGKRIYQNEAYDAMVVLDPKVDRIITVLPSAEKRKEIEANVTPTVRKAIGDNPVIAAAYETIKRELTRARRSFTTEYRKLKIEQAELGVEIAQATVNKIRCKAPHTQALIQARIDAAQTYYDVVGSKIERVQAEYSRMKTEAQAFIGTEVGV